MKAKRYYKNFFKGEIMMREKRRPNCGSCESEVTI